MIEDIMASISAVITLVIIICWFAGVYYSLSEIATAANKIVTLLEKITKENRK